MAENNMNCGSIITKLQRDASECINLFEEFEAGRTWGEWTYDWVVGDIAKINPVRFLIYMEKFQDEVERLLSIYTTLSRKVQWGKTLELGYQENVKFQLNYFKKVTDAIIEKEFNEFSLSISGKKAKEQTCKLETTGIAVGGIVGGAVLGGTALAATVVGAKLSGGIVVPLGLGFATSCLLLPVGIGLLIGILIGSIAEMGHYNAHSSGRERGLDYQTVQSLYDSLHDNKLLSNLETLSSKLGELCENVDMQIDTYKLELGTHRQAIEQKNAGKRDC